MKALTFERAIRLNFLRIRRNYRRVWMQWWRDRVEVSLAQKTCQ